jgi:hypothetical protein
MNLGGFSWKRLLGISQAKARLSRKIGIKSSLSNFNKRWYYEIY